MFYIPFVVAIATYILSQRYRETFINRLNTELMKEIVEYLLRHFKRDLPSLLATLEALDRWSLKTKRPITIPLLKDMNQKDLFQ